MNYRSRAVSSILRTMVEIAPCVLAATTASAATTAKSPNGTTGHNQGSNSLSSCAICRMPSYASCRRSIAFSPRA